MQNVVKMLLLSCACACCICYALGHSTTVRGTRLHAWPALGCRYRVTPVCLGHKPQKESRRVCSATGTRHSTIVVGTRSTIHLCNVETCLLKSLRIFDIP